MGHWSDTTDIDQPPVLDKQAFAEAVGITAAAIAPAGVAGRQEDPNNL